MIKPLKIICDSVKKLIDLRAKIKATNLFCFDAETTGFNHVLDRNTLWTISKCKFESYIIPCEHDAEGFEQYQNLWKNKEWLIAVAEVFLAGFDCEIILGQNVQFDKHRAKKTFQDILKALEDLGVCIKSYLKRFKVPVMVRTCDVQKMYHTIDGAANVCKITGRELFSNKKIDWVDKNGKTHKIKQDGAYSLKYMSTKFFPDVFGKWGGDLEKFMLENGYEFATCPFYELSEYAAYDSVAPIYLYERFKEILIKQDSWVHFWNLGSYMPSIFFHINKRGIYLDIDYALETQKQILKWFKEMEGEVLELPILQEAFRFAARKKAELFALSYLPICPFTGKRRSGTKKQESVDMRHEQIKLLRESKGLTPVIYKGKVWDKWEKERLKKLELTTYWQARILLYGCHKWEDVVKNKYHHIGNNKVPTMKDRNGGNVDDGVLWENRHFKGLNLPPKDTLDKKRRKIKKFVTEADYILDFAHLDSVEHIVYLTKLRNLAAKIGGLAETIGKPKSDKEKKGLLGRLTPVFDLYAPEGFNDFPRAISSYFYTVTGRLSCENHSDPSHANSGNKIVDKAIKRFKGIFKPTPIYRSNPKTGLREKRILFKADYKGAEMVALGMLCKAIGDAIREGKDLHILNACVAAGITLDEFFANFTKLEQKRMRQKGKAVGFGFSFGMYWTRFVEYAYNSYGVEFSDEEAEAIYKRFHERWGLQKGYYKHVAEFVEKYGFVKSLLGYTRHFFMGGERYVDYRVWDKEEGEFIEKRKFFQDRLNKGWKKTFLGWENESGKQIYRGGSWKPIWTGEAQAKKWVREERPYNIKGEPVTNRDIRKSSKARNEINEAINAPIQMTIPDIIHVAFSYLIPELEKLDAWIIKTTHDSLTIECWEGDLFEVGALIKKWLVGSQYTERAIEMRDKMKINFFKDAAPAEFKIEMEVCAWSTADLLEYDETIQVSQLAWLNYLKSTTNDFKTNLEYCRRAKYYSDLEDFTKICNKQIANIVKSEFEDKVSESELEELIIREQLKTF